MSSPKIKGKQLPNIRLEGFRKTGDLKPGQTQHIVLNVKAENLEFWDEMALKNVVYNGLYQFKVGYNSSDIADSAQVTIHGQLTPKIAYVTVQPEKMIYHVGETLNLHGKNKWIKNVTNPAREQVHAVADNIIEAANNDGSFVDLKGKEITYSSDNRSVATVSDNGMVKARGQGVATITATVDGVSGSTVIVVK